MVAFAFLVKRKEQTSFNYYYYLEHFAYLRLLSSVKYFHTCALRNCNHYNLHLILMRVKCPTNVRLSSHFILQCVASHADTRMLFLNGNLFPLLWVLLNGDHGLFVCKISLALLLSGMALFRVGLSMVRFRVRL